MINIDKLKQIKQIFFHASCPDGTASALIIATAFRGLPEPEFISLQYGTDFMNNLEPRHGQLFVDITPPKERWKDWLPFSPVVLDHHETAKEAVLGLNGVYGENATHSGAKLALENVLLVLSETAPCYHEPREIGDWMRFAHLAMIRDTWKKDDEFWKEACAQSLALGFYGSKPLLESIKREPFDFDGFQKLGRMLLESNERRTEKVASGASHALVTDGNRTFKAAFFNCTEKLISDAANYLIDKGADIALGYFYMFEDGQQKMVVSVRTNDSVSASGIAKTFGGGGHARAAGFRIVDANSAPPGILLSYLEQGIASSRG